MTGDWSDSRVVTNTDRTLTSIQLIEKIERLEKIQKQNAKIIVALNEQNHNQLAEIKRIREVLQDCKQMFIAERSFLVKCSRLEDIENILTKISEVLND